MSRSFEYLYNERVITIKNIVYRRARMLFNALQTINISRHVVDRQQLLAIHAFRRAPSTRSMIVADVEVQENDNGEALLCRLNSVLSRNGLSHAHYSRAAFVDTGAAGRSGLRQYLPIPH